MRPVSISPAVINPAPQKQEVRTGAPSNSFSSFMKANADGPSAGERLVNHVATFVDRVESDRKQVDSTLRASAAGRDLDAAELLRVQSLIYDYSQRVELASKVVSSATSGIKQLLNTQL